MRTSKYFIIATLSGIGYILLKHWESIDSAPEFIGVVMTGSLCGFGLYIGMCLVDVLFPPKKEETPKPEIPSDEDRGGTPTQPDTSHVLPAETLKAYL